jgi:5-formyltetrahydrofolate cyclo-ligase
MTMTAEDEAGRNTLAPGENFPMPPEIAEWRNAERKRLIEGRVAVSQDDRTAHTAKIVAGLDKVVEQVSGRVVSLYWPFRGEPDLRPWMETVTIRGGTTVLPLVVAKRHPLLFRAWKKGEPLERGVWNIPIPANGPERVPDIVIAPLVGFDPDCFRLGYGGGFFDRTLASLSKKPLIIGVGYEFQSMPSIKPQRHDIPMDVIITDAGIVERKRP